MRFLKLRIAFSVACAAICLLIGALWVRSYFAFDRVSGRFSAESSFFVFVSYAGRLTAASTGRQLMHENWPKWDSGPILPHNISYADLVARQFSWDFSWDNTDLLWPERGQLGFSWISKSIYVNMPNGEVGWHPAGLTGRSWGANATGFMLPHWFAATVFASLAATPWIRFRFSMRTTLIITTVTAFFLWAAIYSVR